MFWMVRAFPNQEDRINEFLEQNIIAVHWGIGDLTGCNTKNKVANVVAKLKLQPRDASLKTGLLDRFANQMKVGDLCIVPYDEVFYTATIKSDYYFDPNSNKYEHQRKVEWLFNGEPFGREELPLKLQNSIKTQLGLADMSQHFETFNQYINRKLGNEEKSTILENDSSTNEISSLVENAMNILRNEINSDDPDRRLKAAIAVMDLNRHSF